jgi:phosphatidate cytidylyltransferase
VDEDRNVTERDSADPTEGVRIIGAEEAAEAIERGDVARRRSDDEPRYKDRPAPPPDEPRPALRFPLAESADPTEMERPPLAGSPAGSTLPHWTEPATGEVPRILSEEDKPAGEEGEDDLDAWSSFANQAPRWREESNDWEAADFSDISSLKDDDDIRVGALDENKAPVSDMFSFDDEPAPAPEQPIPATPIRTGVRDRAARVTSRVTGEGPYRGGGGRDIPTAVITGVGLGVLALILFSIGPGATMVLVTGIIVTAAAELFGALRKIGYTPATLLGLVATASLVLAAYWRGEAAFPLVLFLMVVFGFLWYLSSGERQHIVTNLGVTVLAVAWVGGLGSFAALLLKFPNGIGMLLAAVIGTVAYDVGGLFVGGSTGRAPLAPNVSPNKTVEGLAGGCIAAVVACVILGIVGLTPWDSFGDALWLGVVVAVAAPLGDLCESLVKRDLGTKDMGSILPGHGGLLDRFDALLFVLPATYYLVRLLELS